jgi:hypothetical protein
LASTFFSTTAAAWVSRFEEAANLDDGDLWPVSYALQQWSAVVEKKVVELVKAAVC